MSMAGSAGSVRCADKGKSLSDGISTEDAVVVVMVKVLRKTVFAMTMQKPLFGYDQQIKTEK
ncbi:hypothetical protein ACVS31_002154 [Salmonella enterica]